MDVNSLDEIRRQCEAEAEAERAQYGKQEATSADTGQEEESPDAFLQRLAGMSLLDYEQKRKEAAKKLGIRATSLDELVTAIRNKKETAHKEPFEPVEPCEEPVNVEALLNEIRRIVTDCLKCPKEAVTAVVLWICLTWAVEHIHTAAILLIQSPEKRCGKTTLLSILGKLTRRTIAGASISPAALYRAVELWAPTLLIDEADTFLKDNQELRGIINSGHTRDTAYVLRAEGDDHTPTKFNTFCCKAIAGIGRQAGTIEDRSIMIPLQRKLPHEKVKRLRHIDPEIFSTLRAKLARFAEDCGSGIGRATPELPEALNDRELDSWEPLFAIAELAGQDWTAAATTAALSLSGADNATQSRSVELLVDIKAIFEIKRVKSIFTEILITELCIDPEKAWCTYAKGKPITARHIAKLLKDFGVKSKDIREGDLVHKGYYRSDFESAFSRYIPTRGADMGDLSATTQQTNDNNDLSQFSFRYDKESVADKKEPKSADLFSSSAVADKNTETGARASCSDKTSIKRFNLQGEVVGAV